MCTMITEQIDVKACARGAKGWFNVRQTNVSFDHPFNFPGEHALNLDFVDESQGLGARVLVEMNAASARALAEAILAVLAKAETAGVVE